MNYIEMIFYLDKGEIIDDLGDELNVNVNEHKNFVSEDEEEDIDIDINADNINSKKNIKLNFDNNINIKKEINSLGNQFNENLFNKIDKMNIDD